MYNIISLESLCKEIIDCPHSTPKWQNEGIPVIRNYNLKDGKIDCTNLSFVSEEDYNERVKRAIPEESDIIISREAPMGVVGIIPEGFQCCLGQRLVLLKIDKSKCIPTYLLYSLMSEYVQLQIRRINRTGSIVSNLNISSLKELKILLHNFEEQSKIATILSSIDDKISLNNQINQELEAMAKTLYDYWFVQFDFPDQNGKPYKSSGGKMVYNPELKREIPEGWGVEKLSSLLEIGRETINPMKTPKEKFKYYSIPEYDVSGSFSYELGETIKSNKFLVEKSDLLVSKLNPWFNRVVYNLEENAISSTEFIVWKTFNQSEKNFLYQVATSKGFIEYCTRFATGTSNSHKRVSPDIMVGFQIPFEKTYIQKFGEITDSIRTQVLQNNVQNQELTQLRNWLLPMLMNGQVKVE